MQVLAGHVRPEIASGKLKPLNALSTAKHLHLSFQLPLRDEAGLKAFLAAICDPANSAYHKYLSVDDFTATYGPTLEDYQRVVEFARSAGLTILDTPRNRMLVEVDGEVSQIQQALRIQLNEYPHPKESRTFYAPDREPSVDSSLKLVKIVGLDDYSKPFRISDHKPHDSAATYPAPPTGSGPFNSFIPSDIRAAYYGSGPLSGKGQAIAIFSFDGFDQVDLDNFYKNTGGKQTVPVNIVLTGGLTAPMGDGGNDAEPILDITYSQSLAPNLDQIRFYECCSPSYSGPLSGVAVILNKIASENIAKQVSISWGWGPEPEVDDPIYEEMAAQGQTVFAASGDYGSPQNPGNNVFDDFTPADDAWVTGVGQTILTTHGPGGAWATETYNLGSGGGYSDGPIPTPLPSYQIGVANGANQASETFRNIPDVTALGFGVYLCGMNQCYPNSGCPTCYNGGSSLAAPVWAGFMALVNEQAEQDHLAPAGFINPLIYKIGASSNYKNAFHDIIGGNNGCCGQLVYYDAVPGYDLVGGWGTPKGQNLINAFLGVNPSFGLVSSADSVYLGPADSTAVNLSVAPSNGFSGSVQLSVSGLPKGISASFSANPTAAASAVTFTSSSAPKIGSYTVHIIGASGSIVNSIPIQFTVSAKQGTIQAGASATNFVLTDGGTPSQSTVSVASVDNFSGSVTLGAVGLPSGVTVAFSPSSLQLPANGSATASMSISAGANGATGPASFTVQSTAGSLVSIVQMKALVNPPFSVGTTSQTFSVGKGQSTAIPVYVTSLNTFQSPVTLSLSPLPKGVIASFQPPAVTPAPNESAISTLTLSVASDAPVGVNTASVIGTSGATIGSEQVSLSVTPPATPFIVASPVTNYLFVGEKGSLTLPITVAPQSNQFAGAVQLSIGNLPSGVQALFNPPVLTLLQNGAQAVSRLTLTASPSAHIDLKTTATIAGTASGLTSSLQLPAEVSGVLDGRPEALCQGDDLTFTYDIDRALVDAGNAIAVYPRGQTFPGDYPLLWLPVDARSGTLKVTTTNLPVGRYDAWFIHDSISSSIAGPFRFEVK